MFELTLAVSLTIVSFVVGCHVGLLFFRRLFGREYEDLGVVFILILGFIFCAFEFVLQTENIRELNLLMLCTVVLARATTETALVYSMVLGSLYLTGIFQTGHKGKKQE